MKRVLVCIVWCAIFLTSPWALACLKDSLTVSLNEASGTYILETGLDNGLWKHEPTGLIHFNYYREKVAARFDVDPFSILRQYRDHFLQNQQGWTKFTDVIQGKTGSLRPINCLEASLLERHLSTHGEAGEFGAFVLTRSHQLRIYIQSSHSVALVSSREMRRRIAKDLKKSWRLQQHIHNHPFQMDTPRGDFAGLPIPGDSDVVSYRRWHEEYGLEQAVVTNGFDSFQVSGKEFSRLKLISP